MNVLSIAIASLVLFASQAAGQVSVNKIFDGKGGYIMEYTVCPPTTIKDFHLILHEGRATTQFDGHVQPVENPTDRQGRRVGGWSAKKTNKGRELVWKSNTGSKDCLVFTVNVGVNSKVRHFNDVFWVTTLTGKGVVYWSDREIAAMGETRLAAGAPEVDVQFRSSFPFLTYTVTSQKDVCDFHVRSLNGRINGRGVAIPGWTMVQRGRLISWYKNDCANPNRTQEFQVEVPAGARLSRSVWYATGAGMPKNKKRPALHMKDVLELGTQTTDSVRPDDVLISYHNDGLDVSPLNSARVGECAVIEVRAPNFPGCLYLLAAAFDIDRGIPLPRGAHFPLNYDALFEISLSTPSLFSGFQGQVPHGGTATAQINIPPIADLAGLDFFVAGILEDLQTISDPAQIHITL